MPAPPSGHSALFNATLTAAAHCVWCCRYNSSHPRTDVHVDDGILALTLAMSPRANYSGGGTFFEHLGKGDILPMEQGQCTIRPGSVRHGGHRVDSGERYILGAFLLIADRVEHVRRLNNQGRAFRGQMDLRQARLHFKWALKINPKCATCLKNWAESLTVTPDESPASPKFAAAAEEKLRRAVTLLPDDSDGWFSLGVLLSSQGRADEALEAYCQSPEGSHKQCPPHSMCTQSVAMPLTEMHSVCVCVCGRYQSALASNADDHELCYNVGVAAALSHTQCPHLPPPTVCVHSALSMPL